MLNLKLGLENSVYYNLVQLENIINILDKITESINEINHIKKQKAILEETTNSNNLPRYSPNKVPRTITYSNFLPNTIKGDEEENDSNSIVSDNVFLMHNYRKINQSSRRRN